MSRWRNLKAFFFPRRASTQRWMMLTFALFVGGAVVLVGLYALVVLRAQVHEAARETLRAQVRFVAERIEAASEEPEAFLENLRQLSSLTPYRIAVARGDSVLWELAERRILSDRSFFERPEVREALEAPAGFGFAEREEQGQDRLYAALYRPKTGYIVRLGQPSPPLFAVAQRMLATLGLGLALALVLALLGAWIAAQQVTRPLRAISRSARRIAEGDLERDHAAEIAVRTRAAEVQDLAKSLGAMAERFRQDIFELQRMQRVQNEFIGNVSHEVKNPIFAVGGYLEALASADLAHEQRQMYAVKGLTNLQRLNNLFSDLIEIAKLEYREDLIHPEPFELQELLAEVAEMLEPKAEAKGLALSYENRPVVVEADRARIRQVLINLIDNAIAYTDEGAVRCRFRRHRDKVRVEVVDTGRGVPEAQLDRIFERFYRVDAARSRAQGGTGLGLAIVKQILQAHGETIHVESTLGRGTRFWFELPLSSAALEEGAPAREALGGGLEPAL